MEKHRSVLKQERAAPAPRRASVPGAPFPTRRGGGQAGAAPTARRVAGTLFRGRWALMTLLVLALSAMMIALGFWQLGRLTGRRAANAAIERQLAQPPLPLTAATAQGLDPKDLAFRRVTVRGAWDYESEIVVRYTSYNGQAGVQVLTPLRLAGGNGEAVLVDRGWIPYQQAEREGRRPFQTEAGAVVEVQGLIHQTQSPGAADARAAQGGERLDAWSRVDLPAIGRQLPYPLLPFYVERLPAPDGSPGPPFPRGLPERGDGSHLSYMLQWWAFTVILLVGYLAVVARATDPRAARATGRRPR